MAHPMDSEVRHAHSGKLNVLGGKGEYPSDRAARIAGTATTNSDAQGDAAHMPDEQWTAAPARQVSNRGNVKGD